MITQAELLALRAKATKGPMSINDSFGQCVYGPDKAKIAQCYNLDDAKFLHALVNAFDAGEFVVPSPSEAKMREALNTIAKQKLSGEMYAEEWEQADIEGGYHAIVKIARETLSSTFPVLDPATVEACAKVADDFSWTLPFYKERATNEASDDAAEMCKEQIAAAIRALVAQTIYDQTSPP